MGTSGCGRRRTLLAVALLPALAWSDVALAHGGCYGDPAGVVPSSYSRVPPGPPSPPPTSVAPVRVLDADGNAVNAASFLQAPGSPWWRVSGGRDGEYSAPCGAEGARYIVTAAGHAPVLTPWIRAEDMLPVTASQATKGPPRASMRIDLPRGHEISGRVLADRNTTRVRLSVLPARARVPEAFAVMAKRQGWEGAVPGSGGTFRFSSLPAGRYSIVVSTPERTVRVMRSVRAGIRNLTIDLEGEDLSAPPVEGLRPDTGRATLRVTADGKTSVQVAAWRRGESQPVARAHGIDVALNVPMGEGLIVVVADPSGGVRALPGVDPGSSRVALPPVPTRVLSGRVVRTDGGSPVVRALVSAVPHLEVPDALFAEAPFRRETRTDANGRFEIPNVAGAVRLLVEAPGLALGAVTPVGAARDDAGDVRMVERRSP